MAWMLWSAGCLLSGNTKGVGRIYQPTFIDTYSKVVAFAKLYDRKTPIAAAAHYSMTEGCHFFK